MALLLDSDAYADDVPPVSVPAPFQMPVLAQSVILPTQMPNPTQLSVPATANRLAVVETQMAEVRQFEMASVGVVSGVVVLV
jgi:hypothetical protein